MTNTMEATVSTDAKIEVTRGLITIRVSNRAHSTQWMDARAREIDPTARLASVAHNYSEPEAWITPRMVRHYGRAR